MTDLMQYGTYTLDQDGCTACGDVAIPVHVLDVQGHAARCEDRLGEQANIAINFVPEARPGDILMIHKGVAIAHVQQH